MPSYPLSFPLKDVYKRQVRVSFGPIIKIADALGVRVRDLIDF